MAKDVPGRYVVRYEDEARQRPLWHVVRPPSRWDAALRVMYDPKDEYVTYCRQVYLKKPDRVFSDTAARCLPAARVPRRKQCGRCLRAAFSVRPRPAGVC